jgi:hypothetical protein
MSMSIYVSREAYEAARRGPDGATIDDHTVDCTKDDCGWSGLASHTGDNWMAPKCPACGAPTTPSDRDA